MLRERSRRAVATVLGVLIACCALGAPLVRLGAQESLRYSSAAGAGGTSEQSFRKARAVLDAGLLAMGGLDALRAVSDITRESSGVRPDMQQGLHPGIPSNNHPRITSIRDYRGQRALDHLRDTILGGQPLELRFVLSGTTAFTADHVAGRIRESTLPSPAVARAVRMRQHPEGLLLAAADRPEALRWIGDATYDGRPQQVISFADLDGAQVALYFDANTRLLTKSETIRDDPVLGDVTAELVFDDYRPAGKLTLPYRYRERVGGATLQELRMTSIVVDSHPADSVFAQPPGLVKAAPPLSPELVSLGTNVWLAPGGYNSIVLAFRDHVMVLEAGSNPDATRATIDQVSRAVPGKPVRYVVATHFHFDHLGGIRSYIAGGATLVTTEHARGVIERAAGASHLLRPDALSRTPRRPVIEVVTDKRVFDDGTQRVELYQIGPNAHVRQMLVAYLPKEKILFEADVLDLPENGTPGAGDDTAQLAAAIERLGLDVERIIPVHGRPGTMADLRDALSRSGSVR